MAAMEKIDGSDYPLVEVKPGVQSGAPVLRGTRMPVDAIGDNFDYGVSAGHGAFQASKGRTITARANGP